MLEDLSSSFVEAFGSHFWIDPYLFAAQESAIHWIGSNRKSDMPRRLPSMSKVNPFFTLRYYEVIELKDTFDRKAELITDSNVHHSIEQGDLDCDGKYLIRRNTSFWSQSTNGGGWNAAILVEPAIGKSITCNKKSHVLKWAQEPYQQGYVDFSAWPNTDIQGPLRTTIFDDISYYWTFVATPDQVAQAQKDAAKSAVYLKKIAAWNWMVVIEYIWATLSTLEIDLWSFEQKDHTPRGLLRSLEGTLARANHWRRRLSWYMNELEASLQNLSIPLEHTLREENKRTDEDHGEYFLLVLRRLRACKELLDSFMTIVTGVLSVIQGELSLEDNELSL